MEEAKTAILNIVDPPKAELDKEYDGRVVNITKFGAFVNILPGRDGLLHISKMGGGKRINSVDDVLELGQVVKVKVEEIDDKGKVSLMLSEELDIPEGATSGSGGGGGDRGGRDNDRGGREERAPRRERSDDRGNDRGGDKSASASDVVEVSFEDSFDAELAGELGDLGPKSERPAADRDGGNRGGGNGGARRRHR